MGKSWNEKLTGAPAPHTSVLKKPFGGLHPGDTMFIASPLMVRDYMRQIPPGERRTDLADARGIRRAIRRQGDLSAHRIALRSHCGRSRA